MKPNKKKIRPRRANEITAVYADRSGSICEADDLRALGRIGAHNVPITSGELIPLPDSADLMFMPAHTAVGMNGAGEEAERFFRKAIRAPIFLHFTVRRTLRPCRSTDIRLSSPIAENCVLQRSIRTKMRNGTLPTIMEKN